MTPKQPTNGDIINSLAEIREMVQSSDRALRGYDGEIGLVARVTTIETFIKEEKTTKKEIRDFWKKVGLLVIAELLGILVTAAAMVMHFASSN